MPRAAALLAVTLLATSALLAAAPAAPAPALFFAGFAQRDITPPPELSHDGRGNVYLGGFGLGPVRLSTGVQRPIAARAFVVGDGQHWLALASVEVQGSFAAYQRGAYGQYDIAKSIESATQGVLTREGIILSSDHSHRGPDTTGAWGFLPHGYMAYIASQTRDAVVAALGDAQPARLRSGSLDARDFLSSDFWWPGENLVDPSLRVLVAEDLGGALRGVFGTFAAHATREGSGGSDPRISPDWPGAVSDFASAALGAPVVLAEGAVGRTHSQDPEGVSGSDAWERALAARVEEAVLASGYITRPGVQADVDMVTLTAWNAGLLALNMAGSQGCAVASQTCVPLQRNAEPPWQEGNLVRTLVSVARVGDVFLWGAPGELYPDAHATIQDLVAAREHFILGLANDQLGYLIAPTEHWPLVVAHAPVSDNAFFNVDATSGDHLMCAALDGARHVGFTVRNRDSVPPELGGSGALQDPLVCRAWAGEDRALPP